MCIICILAYTSDGFYCPYISQQSIGITANADQLFTLITTDMGHSSHWVVCEFVGKVIGKDPAEGEIKGLKKFGVLRTDSCGTEWLI